MKNVEALLEIFTNTEFISKNFMKEPLVFDAWNLFLKTARLPHYEKVIWKHAENFPRSLAFYHKGSSYSMSMFDAYKDGTTVGKYQFALERWQAGNPIIVSQLHESNLFYGEIAKGLGDFYKADVQSMIIYSSETARGANKHIDRSHLFAFQHEGECRWIIHDRGRRKKVMDTVLKPGQILHVPQGFCHQLERLSKFHSHVSVGMRYDSPRAEVKMLHFHPALAPAIPPYHSKLTRSELRTLINSYPDMPIMQDN